MKFFVPILYRDPAFEAFGDFSNFVESVSYGTSKTCQVRGFESIKFPLGFIEVYQRSRRAPTHPTTQLPTQKRTDGIQLS
jgi:hypothetical protein